MKFRDQFRRLAHTNILVYRNMPFNHRQERAITTDEDVDNPLLDHLPGFALPLRGPDGDWVAVVHLKAGLTQPTSFADVDSYKAYSYDHNGFSNMLMYNSKPGESFADDQPFFDQEIVALFDRQQTDNMLQRTVSRPTLQQQLLAPRG